MSDTADPGAALPSRVQEWLKKYGGTDPEGLCWSCREGYGEHTPLCEAALIRDLASALQQREATCEALSNLCADRQAHLAAVSSALQQTQAENETLRMQLVACSSAALMNTESTIGDRVTRENPYWSVAYADVCRAVDREIAHRAQLAEAEAAHQRLRAALTQLTAQWRQEADDYPRTDYRAEIAAIAVQLCAKELDAALASPESAA